MAVACPNHLGIRDQRGTPKARSGFACREPPAAAPAGLLRTAAQGRAGPCTVQELLLCGTLASRRAAPRASTAHPPRPAPRSPARAGGTAPTRPQRCSVPLQWQPPSEPPILTTPTVRTAQHGHSRPPGSATGCRLQQCHAKKAFAKKAALARAPAAWGDPSQPRPDPAQTLPSAQARRAWWLLYSLQKSRGVCLSAPLLTALLEGENPQSLRMQNYKFGLAFAMPAVVEQGRALLHCRTPCLDIPAPEEDHKQSQDKRYPPRLRHRNAQVFLLEQLLMQG